MLTRAQLEEIKARMEADHQRDREALERIMRFLPDNSGTPKSPAKEDGALDLTPPPFGGSILGSLEIVVKESPSRTWTAQQLKAELEARGVELKATNPLTTIGVAMGKLSDRGKVNIVRRGSGRQPNIYQWRTLPKEERAEEPL